MSFASDKLNVDQTIEEDGKITKLISQTYCPYGRNSSFSFGKTPTFLHEKEANPSKSNSDPQVNKHA